MFSTFTGTSRRPRNVNLSGQSGNPFANSSWTPSAASKATKTVSMAQADRERRQTERQRLKAASKIQSAWRGYRTRRSLADQQRTTFDGLYLPVAAGTPLQRLTTAPNLVLAFYSVRCSQDARRVVLLARDAEAVALAQLLPATWRSSRNERLMHILVQSLDSVAQASDDLEDLGHILRLIIRLMVRNPSAIIKPIAQYFRCLARLCQFQLAEDWLDLIVDAISAPLKLASGRTLSCVYDSFAFDFLTRSDMVLFQLNLHTFAHSVHLTSLSEAIRDGYEAKAKALPCKADLLSLLSHFVGLGRQGLSKADRIPYLQALICQLSYLSADIVVALNSLAEPESGASVSPFVSSQLASLVDQEQISSLLRDFSKALSRSPSRELQETSILAGYVLMLLHCFPEKADEIRMRLFLEELQLDYGRLPTIRFLWQIMKQTSVLQRLASAPTDSVDVVRRYLHGNPREPSENSEDPDWRIILLFLELYIFILRLSDDEDFFSGMNPQSLESAPPASRLRFSSLSREDVGMLTTFLKNTVFTLHYSVNALTQLETPVASTSSSRLDAYLGVAVSPSPPLAVPDDAGHPRVALTKLSLDSLRSILTTAFKMLHERDSRQHFTSPDHWLMNGKFEQEDFVEAVLMEEEQQERQEGEDDDEQDETDPEDGLDVHTATLPAFSSGTISPFAGGRLSRQVRLERLKALQVRSQKERRLAELSPKLEILKHIPFVVPFETRVMIFRQFVQQDRARRGGDSFFSAPSLRNFPKHSARIRRGRLFEDAYQQFYEVGEGLKDPIQITFVDQFDTPEAGIDGGGVTKEFLTSVTSEAFKTEDGVLSMFATNEQDLLFPNPTAADTLRESLNERGVANDSEERKQAMASLLRRYEFLGRIVGKCLYEGILVDLAFAGFFLLKWPSAGPKEENAYKGSFNDLRDMDEELYKGMLRLKNYDGDVADLGFDFTVEDQVSIPGQPIRTVTRKLIPDGDQVAVTNDNRLLYISYMARHRLVAQPFPQTAAFLRGLRSIVRPSWLSMFDQSELQRLVGGDSSEIDVEDLRRNTVYSGLYEIGDDGQEHATVKLFWKVMHSFTDAQRRDVLKYVSSTPRAPLLGFSQLRPKFSIRDGGTDEERLPSTSTCVNLLKLPRYRQESRLRQKLLYAVTSGAGFDLS